MDVKEFADHLRLPSRLPWPVDGRVDPGPASTCYRIRLAEHHRPQAPSVYCHADRTEQSDQKAGRSPPPERMIASHATWGLTNQLDNSATPFWNALRPRPRPYHNVNSLAQRRYDDMVFLERVLFDHVTNDYGCHPNED